MAFELKEGQGTLFVNDKQGVENRPDRQGQLNIGGTLYRLSGWIKQGKAGPWLSLSAEIPRSSGGSQPAPEKPSVAKYADADEVPF